MTDRQHPNTDADGLPPSVAAALAELGGGAPPAPEAVGRVMRAVRTRPAPVRASPVCVDAVPRRRVPASRWRAALAACIVAAAGVGTAVAARGSAARKAASRGGDGALAPTASLGRSQGTASAVVPARHVAHFVVLAPGARRVTVVGDFNGWRARATPMRRDPLTGFWAANVGLPQGRYVYAYLVDDARWMSDPNAPLAPADGFGRQSSVLVLGAQYAVR